ncbi:MAG: MoaD/ThiS family protein [Candidatus Hodarchaeales archaeon]|jgi:molybdopterin converting factor small subunit
MTIRIKFLGSLQYDLKQSSYSFQTQNEATMQEVVSELTKNPQFAELRTFFTEALEIKRSLLIFLNDLEIKRSLLIFLNDQEISVLDGMKTRVKAKDTISFIPVIHGG